MFSPPRWPMLRSPRLELLLTLMISAWSTRECTLLPSSLRREERTLTRCWASGSPRLLMLLLRWPPPRMKAATDEAVEQLDIVKRENKNLADEIKDLLDQLGEGGRSIHDLDKQRRRLEQEKEELQAALEEAEGTLEQEENKVLRAQLELGQVKQEIDRRVAEKEDEFNNTRKNHARAMDSLGASIETEQ